MSVIPEKYKDILGKVAYAHLCTLMPNGSPQSTPVWFHFNGEQIEVNSAFGRQKDKNMRANPHVAISIIDPDNNFRYLEIRGKVVKITEEGARESIDRLAKKYVGQDKYTFGPPDERRVLYYIQPVHCTCMG